MNLKSKLKFIIRQAKNTLVFVIVAAFLFSNIPFEFFSKIISDKNIVDNIWLSQKDSNVVDKFVPFQRVIDNLKVNEALAVAQGDGKIFYSIAADTTPRTRDYINSSDSFNVAATTVAGATGIRSELRASPTKDEMTAGYIDSAGNLQVMCWNGTTWTNEWSVATGGVTRRFDIAYETNSGDVMVLYSGNIATTNELRYRTKSGASACGSANWSAETNLDPVRTSGVVHWVKMAWDRRASSNLITAIWADANADLSAMVWSGTAWGNEPTAALETALEIVTTGQDVESFDVEYESLSGDVMIVRGSGGTNGTNGGYYSVCTGGTSTCAWGARTAMPTILDDTTHIDISADPNSDSILFGAIGNAGSDLSRGVWSGTAWTNTADADTTTAAPAAGTMFVATGWLISGANTRGVLVYYDSAATNIGWMTVSGTVWTNQTDFTVSPVFGTQRSYMIKMDPLNKDRLMLVVNDANSDIHAKRLTLSGTTFTWTNSTGGNPVEANAGSTGYKPFDFEYNRYIPANSPPTLSISQPDGVADTVNVGDLYNITYSLADTDNVVTAAFYYDVDNIGLNGTAITGACATTAEGTNVTCSWNTAGMTAGAYYVYGLTSDGVNPQVSAYSSGMITINAALTFTIGATAGSKVANLNSGDTLQYANSTTCNSAATCAAFTMLSSGGETLNSVKITETGTTNATNNLASLALFYDIDGNYTNGVTGQYGTTVATFTSEAATVSGSLAMTAGTTYYFYVRFDLINGANDPAGGETVNFQIALNGDVTTSAASTKSGAPVSLVGTTIVKPNAVSVTYQVGGDGGRSGYSATITGNGFGVAPVGSRGNCSGAVNTGCVQFVVGGTATVATGDVSSWGDRSISFAINSALASEGGASALQVSAGGQADATPLTFYIYPTIFSVTNCDKLGFPLGAFGREYDATDSACPNTLTDGAVVLTGDHFGSAGSVTILGSAATQSAVAAFCGGSAYTSTCTALQVPAGIADTLNAGDIILTRTSDSKTGTYTGFRVLPRITGFTPGSASEGSSVTVDGNHFCQGASCPLAFDASNKVTFASGVGATTFVSWTATTMGTTVPTGAVTGDVVLTSNGYASNGKSFTVLSNTPNNPTSLDQFKDAGLTQSIAVGATASSTPIYLKQAMEVPGILGGTLYPQFEYQLAGTNFVCGAGACASAVEGIGSAGPGPATGSKSISPADGNYHWQARTRHNKSGTDYYSAWVSFGGNSDPSGIDFKIDTTAPVISLLSYGTPTSNAATITWSTDENASTQLAYGTDPALGAGTATTTEADISPTVTSHSVSLSNLSCGTAYYYRARSRDDAGIASFSVIQNFTTSACPSAPAKTTKFHIAGSTGTVTNGSPFSQSFLVDMPETATTTKSIFVEIKGIYSSGVAPKDITVAVNSESPQTYVVPASSVSYFKIIHQVSAISPTNTLTITPNANTTLYILSADVNITYSYTP